MKSNRLILRIALAIQLLFVGFTMLGQHTTVESSIHQNVQLRTNEIFDSLVKIRRDFHMHPEVSGQEKRTSEKIANYLLALGLEVKTNIGGHGVVGILQGSEKGKHIAWRADMDAMASDIPDLVDYQSKNEGVRHICGHDVNTTIALGIANVMASQRKNLKGTVYFIFQPSEEDYTGAKAMIDDGLFEMIHPDEIYGSHIAPLSTNMISTKPNWMFADYKVIQVSYKNSDENEVIIEYTKDLLSSLQNIAPDSKFWNPQNLLDPNIGLGNPNTIFKDYVTVSKNFKVDQTDTQLSIKVNVSSSMMKKFAEILPMLREKINGSAYSKLLMEIQYTFERPNVLNDEKLTAAAMKSISTTYGADKTVLLYGEMPDGRGDDFAYFQEQVPGVYFYLGGSNFETGIISMPHAPNFVVDESCIKTGVSYFSSMILDRLMSE